MVSLRWIILGVLLFVSTGCNTFAATPTPSPTPNVAPSLSAPPSATGAPVPTVAASPTIPVKAPSYTDSAAGFGIDIPSGWTIQDVDPKVKQTQRGYSVTFLSWAQQTPWKGEMPAGSTMMQATVTRWEPLDLARYVAMRKGAWGNSNVGIVSEEEWTLAGNLKATRFILKADKGNEFVLFALLKDRFIDISGAGDLDLVAGIARTLRPLAAAP